MCCSILCETFHSYIEMPPIKDYPIWSDVINCNNKIFQKFTQSYKVLNCHNVGTQQMDVNFQLLSELAITEYLNTWTKVPRLY